MEVPLAEHVYTQVYEHTLWWPERGQTKCELFRQRCLSAHRHRIRPLVRTTFSGCCRSLVDHTTELLPFLDVCALSHNRSIQHHVWRSYVTALVRLPSLLSTVACYGLDKGTRKER